MKKRNLKSLHLNKKSISNLEGISGGELTFNNCNTKNNCYTDFNNCSVIFCISNSPFLPPCASDDPLNPIGNNFSVVDC